MANQTNKTYKLGKLDDYVGGKIANDLLEQGNVKESVDVMKSLYLDPTNPILAIAFLQTYHSDNPSSTAVGQRIAIENKNYQTKLSEMDFDGVLNSCLGKGLEDKVSKAISSSIGKKNVGGCQKDKVKYTSDMKIAEANFKKAIIDAGKDETKLQKARSDYEAKIKGITNKYDLKSIKTFDLIETPQLEKFKSNILLESMYLKDEYTIEKLEEIANS
tara:strand:- start:610 stop:1260 length:651 start_codon:yes stop_codon:yes gene_type:complete